MQPQDMMSLGENGVKISRKTMPIGTEHLNPLHQDQDQVLFGAHLLFQTRGKETETDRGEELSNNL